MGYLKYRYPNQGHTTIYSIRPTECTRVCVVMMDALSWSLDTQRTDAIFVESATDWQMM